MSSEVVNWLMVVAQQLTITESRTIVLCTLWGNCFTKIAQSDPPNYQGKPNFLDVEGWLKEFNKLFMAVRCQKEVVNLINEVL